MDRNQYLQNIYGGIIGKCVGVRLGAPVEPVIWTYERIKENYGDITGYIKEYKNFAADDDINGPLFFIRSLFDNEYDITAKEIGHSWLNYTRENIGFYWWGGYGISTEHTAYLNLKSGIEAPDSGSKETNGLTLSEQIGGQIFSDSWGWIFPDDPESASKYAHMASSVSHDRNGIYGGIFMAVCNSLAFNLKDIQMIIEEAIKWIPENSEYACVINSVKAFYLDYPSQWRKCREMLEEKFGYDKYPGVCHIIPNAGVCALALYYGKGDFARTVEIATMCGWDTDCNAGNVGSILGVIHGPSKIPGHYRDPINDFHAASSISGALNILDLPTAAKEIAILGLKKRKESIPEEWKKGTFSDDIYFDFALPGSTSGFRTSSKYKAPKIRNNGAKFLIDNFNRGETARIFYKTYYCREDFDDQRYSPTFTPLVFPGQNLHIRANMNINCGNRISIATFIRDNSEKRILKSKYLFLDKSAEFEMKWELPDVPFAIDEVGLVITNFEKEAFSGLLELKEFHVSGKKTFRINFKDEKKEFDCLSRCSCFGGSWDIENRGLHVLTEKDFYLCSGPYYLKDCYVESEIIPERGNSHLVMTHSSGAEKGYFFGFSNADKVALYRKNHEISLLQEENYQWEIGREYGLAIKIIGNEIFCFVNKILILSVVDELPLPYGMAGVAKLNRGRTLFRSLFCEEI